MIRFSIVVVTALSFVSPAVLARDKQQRIHLTLFKVLHENQEIESRSHLDVGIEETSVSGVRRCEILGAPKAKPSEKTWEPLDFYTQVAPSEQAKHKATLGQVDYYFKGDDFNRNGDRDAHNLTRELAGSLKSSLTFTQKITATTKEYVEVLVGFKRGPLKFDRLMRAIAFETKNGCDAALVYCTTPSTVGNTQTCAPDGWTMRALEINATADLNGFLADKSKTLVGYKIADTDRTDVFRVVAMSIPADADPETTVPVEDVLAEKKPPK